MKYVYGPVPSRRLGRSLGVDLIPMKICTFSCIYCQLGKTLNLSIERKKYIPEGEVVKEIEKLIKKTPPDYITLSGSGEPTLYSGIDSLVNKIKKITSIPIALLTNGTLFYLPEVRKEVMDIDLILPSLDASCEKEYKLINRPDPSIKYENLIEGLKKLRAEFKGKIYLEIMFVKGFNDSEKSLNDFKNIIEKIGPDKIHINTVVRPPAEKIAKPVNKERLIVIKNFLKGRSEIITSFKGSAAGTDIFDVLKRRPMTMNDIVQITGKDKKEIEEDINKLLIFGKIIKKGKYYLVEEE